MVINPSDPLHKLLAIANAQRGKAIIADFDASIVANTPPAFIIAFVGEDAPRVQRMIADKLQEAGMFQAAAPRNIIVPGVQ